MTNQLKKGRTIPIRGKKYAFIKLYISHFPQHNFDLLIILLLNNITTFSKNQDADITIFKCEIYTE